MPDATDEELRETIRERARVLSYAGFYTRQDVLEMVSDIAEEGEDCEALRAYALEQAEAAWAEKAREEATWSGLTDCERLDRAFAELEEVGVVARQNFWCCQTCGVAAMAEEELPAARAAGRRTRGYVFYHEQDTDGAVESDCLYLSYGGDPPSGESASTIAREAQAVLLSHGLAAEWNGDVARRIKVPLVWRRRSSPA